MGYFDVLLRYTARNRRAVGFWEGWVKAWKNQIADGWRSATGREILPSSPKPTNGKTDTWSGCAGAAAAAPSGWTPAPFSAAPYRTAAVSRRCGRDRRICQGSGSDGWWRWSRLGSGRRRDPPSGGAAVTAERKPWQRSPSCCTAQSEAAAVCGICR